MVSSRATKSVYARGKRHMLLTLAAMPVIVWGVPLVATQGGVSIESTIIWLVMPLGVVLLLFGGLGSLLIRCSACGKSVFTKHLFGFFAYSVPWPERQCSRCGNDLTEAPTISELERAI